jgi:nucleoid DNA-binding protein
MAKTSKGMNRAALNEAVAKELGCSKAAADRAVGAVTDSIAKALKKGSVSIVGFGTFKVKARKARMGRNPKTGEQIKIKASKSVGFKAGRPLKERL